MHIIKQRLYDKEQTGKSMKALVENYNTDLDNIYLSNKGMHIPLSDVPLPVYFDIVRKIPYRQDEKPVEVVARPYYVFKNRMHGADCKKKAVLMGAWLKRNGFRYRFIASSRMPSGRIHHVFPQGYIEGEWKNLDATYAHYKPYQIKTVTKAEIL